MRNAKTKAIWAAAMIAVCVFSGGFAVAKAAYKSVTVVRGSRSQVIKGFTFGDVRAFLKQHDITWTQTDRISPSPSAPVRNGMEVEIEPPKRITLVDGKIQIPTQTFAPTVQDFLDQQGIMIGSKDSVDVPLQSKLADGERIRIEHVQTKTESETRTLQFQTIRRHTNQLYAGEQRELTHGVEGSERIETVHVYRNGKLVSTSRHTTIVTKPVNQIIEIGTKPKPIKISARGIGSLVATKKLTVLATAYVEGGTTATGVAAVPGVIAVDPSVIPFGTKLYIPGVGIVKAEDTGGAIVGMHIDICMSSLAQALQWGARTITVYEIQ